MAKKAILILADGFEEIEAITPLDILRRAGVDVIAAGLENTSVKGARGTVIQADTTLCEAIKSNFDAIILPGGGPGAEKLASSEIVTKLIKRAHQNNKIIAAICAAPSLVLAPTGILTNRSVTGFPGMMENFSTKTRYQEAPVVVDKNIITSRGPATALAFAFAISEKLVGKDITDKVRKQTLAI